MNLGLLAGVCLLGCFAGSQNVSNEKEADFMSKMHQLGYSDQEINAFSAEKKQKFEKFDIIYSQSMESVMEAGESIEQIGERESKIDTQSLNDEATVSDGKRTMKSTLSYVKTGTNVYRFLLKTDVKWDTIPKERLSDIIGYQYDSNFVLTKDSGYPDIEIHQKYHYYYYHYIKTSGGKATTNTQNEDIDIKHTGSDSDAYNIDLQKHHIGFEFALPEDYNHTYSHKNNRNIEKKEYTDFSYSIECFFGNAQSSFKKGPFQTVFLHQNNTGRIDWGKIKFTLTKPYFDYETNFWIDDPGFEEGISNYLVGKVE